MTCTTISVANWASTGRDFYLSRARYFSEPSQKQAGSCRPSVLFFFFLYWPNYLGPLEEVASLVVSLCFLRRLLGFAPWFLPRVSWSDLLIRIPPSRRPNAVCWLLMISFQGSFRFAWICPICFVSPVSVRFISWARSLLFASFDLID